MFSCCQISLEWAPVAGERLVYDVFMEPTPTADSPASATTSADVDRKGAPSGTRGLRVLALLPTLLALVFLSLYFLAERHTLGGLGFPLDDSYIHLQFARELAAGNGLAFNPGELSTGSTSPLWTALLSLGFLLPGLELLWPKLLGAVLLLGTLAGSRRLLEIHGASPLFQNTGAILLATTPWLLWSALSGMEVLLFTGLLVWTLVLEARTPAGHPPDLGAPCLAALAALARPEGLLLLALVLAGRLLRIERVEMPGGLRLALRPVFSLWPALAIAALIVLPLLVFQGAVSDSIFPSTLAAKTVPDGNPLPNARYLGAALDVLWDGGGVLLAFAGAGLLLLLRRSAEGRGASPLAGIFFFALPLAYSMIASDKAPPQVGNFGRYLFPLFPLLVVLALLALESGLKPLRDLRFGRFRLDPVVPLLVLLVASQGFQAFRGVARYAQNLKNVADSDVAAARYLAQSGLPAEVLIATQDIGAIKFYLPNRVLDLTGIVSPEILPVLRAESPVYWEERLHDFLATAKPDLVVCFSNAYPGFSQGRIGGFQRVASFAVKNNVTMGGDELVILKTPWYRFGTLEP